MIETVEKTESYEIRKFIGVNVPYNFRQTAANVAKGYRFIGRFPNDVENKGLSFDYFDVYYRIFDNHYVMYTRSSIKSADGKKALRQDPKLLRIIELSEKEETLDEICLSTLKTNMGI